MKTVEIKKVVVRGTNWVGDAMMTVPALRELRRVLPAAEITLCTRQPLDGLFNDADFIDSVLIDDKDKSIFNRAKSWRESDFDAAVLFPNSFESALLAFLGKVKRRIGYRTDGRGLLLSDALKVPTWKTERHEVFYYLNIIAALEQRLSGETAILESEPDIKLNVSETRRESAKEFLAANGVDLRRKIVALCAGSTNSRAKRWGAENFAALADLIRFELNAEVILIGSPDELEISAAVLANSKSKPILLTGKTNLAEVVAILAISDLLVTNDTGPAHIAPAVGTKTIVIFGPTIPATTRPFSDLAEIVRNPPACAPCMLRDCPIDHRCMTVITPAEILRRIDLFNFRFVRNRLRE